MVFGWGFGIEVSPSKKTVPEKFRNPNSKRLRMAGDVNRIHRANEIPYREMKCEVSAERVSGRQVRVSFKVTNKSRRVVNLPFMTAKRYEMRVMNRGGRVVFDSSAERAYAEVLGTVMINPNDSVVYEEVVSLPAGNYLVQAHVVGHEALYAEGEFSVR
jgi:hypothetical protein